MVKRSTVTFVELRHLLLDLGFSQTKRDRFWFFEHPPSETWFAFRPYRSHERVTLIDVHCVRGHLDLRGLLSERQVNELLKQADDKLLEFVPPRKGRTGLPARSTVKYGTLRQFLLDLGFTQGKRGRFPFFEHPRSGTVFGLRPYRSNERVLLRDLFLVRRDLDWRGVLREQKFADVLKEATV